MTLTAISTALQQFQHCLLVWLSVLSVPSSTWSQLPTLTAGIAAVKAIEDISEAWQSQHNRHSYTYMASFLSISITPDGTITWKQKILLLFTLYHWWNVNSLQYSSWQWLQYCSVLWQQIGGLVWTAGQDIWFSGQNMFPVIHTNHLLA